MSIPEFQTLMLPLLHFLKDQEEHSMREAIEFMSVQFSLTEDERQYLLPSGQQTRIQNRTSWARSYLQKAGLVESLRRGFIHITQRGLEVLNQNPKRIDIKFLKRFPEFLESWTLMLESRASRRDRKRERKQDPKPSDDASEETPEEALEAAYQRLRIDIEEELLGWVKSCSPNFFERLVVGLLVKMGYGGTLRDAGEAIGRSGDGGIDGIIKEDRLRLDAIYIQAKRWDGTVGRPEVQKFAGALQGHHARKGVFITTAQFSEDAIEFTTKIDSKIVLIDGQTLARLMFDHNIGVSTSGSYDIKKIDSGYFDGEQI